jgi:hypothetical protein
MVATDVSHRFMRLKICAIDKKLSFATHGCLFGANCLAARPRSQPRTYRDGAAGCGRRYAATSSTTAPTTSSQHHPLQALANSPSRWCPCCSCCCRRRSPSRPPHRPPVASWAACYCVGPPAADATSRPRGWVGATPPAPRPAWRRAARTRSASPSRARASSTHLSSSARTAGRAAGSKGAASSRPPATPTKRPAR